MSITKEQALSLPLGATITKVDKRPNHRGIEWTVTGKLKTWERDTTRFQLPIKHGLSTIGYLTNDNAHLFTLKQVQP